MSQRRARGKRERRTHTKRCARERHEKKGDAFFNDRNRARKGADEMRQEQSDREWRKDASLRGTEIGAGAAGERNMQP